MMKITILLILMTNCLMAFGEDTNIIDMDIVSLTYNSPYNLEGIESKVVGSAITKKLFVRNSIFSADIRPVDQVSEFTIQMEDNYIDFISKYTSFGFDSSLIPIFKGLKFIDVTNLKIDFNEDLDLSSEIIKLGINDNNITTQNLSLHCSESKSQAPICYNSGIVYSTEENQKAEFKFEIPDVEISGSLNKLELSTNLIKFSESNLAFNHKEHEVLLSGFNAEGNKSEEYSIDPKDIIRNGIENFKFSAQNITYKNTVLKSTTSLTVDSLSMDGDKIDLTAKSITGVLDNFQYSTSKLNMRCAQMDLGDDYQYGDLTKGCLKESKIETGPINLKTDKYSVLIDSDTLSVTPKIVSIKGPLISFKMGNLETFFRNVDISCKRDSKELISVSELAKGCFDSSSIKIEQIDIKDKNIKLKINIKRVALDKNRILLSIPLASYKLNNSTTTFRSILFDCQLDANIDNLNDLDWETVLENCLKNSTIFFESMNSVNDDKAFISFEDVKKLNYRSKNHKFHLTAIPKVKIWGMNTFNIHPVMDGDIHYDRATKRIVIHFTKIKIAAIVPATKLILFLGRSFIKDERLKIDGDYAYIDLKEKPGK